MTIQSERCRICEKMVPKEEYKAHFADLHPAFKPYKCKICVTVGFFEPEQLNDHMLTKHAKMMSMSMIAKNAYYIPRNSVKPSTEKLPEKSQENDCKFNCVICLDSFKTGLLLDQHYDNAYKHDAASYKCGLCLRRFISEDKREKHIGDFHSVPDTQTEVSQKFFKLQGVPG